MAKSYSPSIITTPLVLSMATLMLVLVGLLVTVGSAGQKVAIVTKAAPEPSLLSPEDDAATLDQDLKYLNLDPVSEEMKVMENLK